jgi:hypothetical protein
MAKRKQTDAAPPVKYLHLECRGYTEVTREADPEDSWGAADTSTSWSTDGVSLSDKDGQHALPADFEVEVGDTVYVVFAVYSTGDTFHRADGEYLEVLSFHKDAQRAYRNKAAAEGPRGKEASFSMTIEFENGKKVSRHCPWDGYFESLDYVSVDSYTVQAHSKRW